MTYLIISDTHFDSLRLDENYSLIKQVHSIIDKYKPDYYIHAGDLTEKRNPNKQVVRLIIEHFYYVKNRVKKILIRRGNHDNENANDYSFDYLLPICKDWNIEVYNEPIIFDGFYIDHCSLAEVPINDSIYLNGESYKALIKKYPQVKHFIFGHVHHPQFIQKNPIVLVPGSTQITNFSEANEQKAVYLFKDENPLLSSTIFETIQLNVTPFTEITYECGKEHPNLDFSKLWGNVKLHIIGTKTDILLEKEFILQIKRQLKLVKSVKVCYTIIGNKSKSISNTGSFDMITLFNKYLKEQKVLKITQRICQKIIKNIN